VLYSEITKFGELTIGDLTFGEMTFSEVTFAEVAFSDLTFGEPTGHRFIFDTNYLSHGAISFSVVMKLYMQFHRKQL